MARKWIETPLGQSGWCKRITTYTIVCSGILLCINSLNGSILTLYQQKGAKAFEFTSRMWVWLKKVARLARMDSTLIISFQESRKQGTM
jgi:nitrate reductase gamma subunit